MSNNIFYSAPCLSNQLSAIKSDELIKKGDFRKNIDRRYMSQVLHKFIEYNQENLDFLDINTYIRGIDPNVDLQFETGKYVGAIPLRLPGNGKPAGDLIVYPRFSYSENNFSDLSKILILIEDIFRPEFLDSIPLSSGNIVRPPLYFDSIIFVNLYEKALNFNWKKFDMQKNIYPYPKSNVNWNEYIQKENNPIYKLQFPVNDSVLHNNHKEWKKLKYVFDLSYNEIMSKSTPKIIQIKVKKKLNTIKNKEKNIISEKVEKFQIFSIDPPIIKELKKQANILLNQKSEEIKAWRIDISILFERYIQFIIKKISLELPIKLISNGKFYSKGNLPSWGIRYLEPDGIIISENLQIFFDVKYKSHLYNLYNNTEYLHESHRSDLHQIFSYTSFSNFNHKIGILFYPSDNFYHKKVEYMNNISGMSNLVFFIGIPFNSDLFFDTKDKLKKFFMNILDQEEFRS